MNQRVIFLAWWSSNQLLGRIVFITQSDPLPNSSLPGLRWRDRLEGPRWSLPCVRLPKHAVQPGAKAFLCSLFTGRRWNHFFWTSYWTAVSSRPTEIVGPHAAGSLQVQHVPGPGRRGTAPRRGMCAAEPGASPQIAWAVRPLAAFPQHFKAAWP